MRYSIEQTIKLYDDKSNQLKFIFFWGNHSYGRITETCLSQWYDSSFKIEEVEYYNMEQYMMSEKALLFDDTSIREQILKESSPKKVKAFGRKIRNFDEKVWDKHKCNIIVKGNYAKFSQNPDLEKFILSTGNKILVEASPYDKIWGIGMGKNNLGVENPYNWKGQNLLGFSLMEVRDKL